MWVKILLFAFLMYQVDAESVTGEYYPIFAKFRAEIEATAVNNNKQVEDLTAQIGRIVAKTQKSVDVHVSELRKTVAQAQAHSDKNIDFCVKKVERTIASVSGILNPCLEPESLQLVQEEVARVNGLSREVQRKKNSCVNHFSFQPNRLRNCFDETIADANQILATSQETIAKGNKDSSAESNVCVTKNLVAGLTALDEAESTFYKCVHSA